MSKQSTEFAIVGAGPAGAHLASRLAGSGREVVLFDPKGAWEKPCGGGVPTRALREFSFILESTGYPRKLIRRITLISPVERQVTLKLARPFAIFSRKVLNGLLLDRAIEAGAHFARVAVSDFNRERNGWTISTDDGRQWRARYLVGADGAASFTRRRLVGIFPLRDIALAFGYNVADSEQKSEGEETEETVIVRFPHRFTGYLWAFPRPGAMNFGVASKLGERTSTQLRTLLGEFVSGYYGDRMPKPERVTFFGAKIPTLDLLSWKSLRTTGDGWALIGDASGFADPITGEGIYYAIKSADLMADALTGAGWREKNGQRCEYNKGGERYEALWREAFGRDLEHASYRLPQFYHGHFLGHIFTDAVVRLARHHRGVREVLMRALVGEQSYVTLKRDLLRRAFQVF